MTVSGNVSGIFNINKPSGLTSHDVVNRVRQLVGTRKVGHAGTLDPMATGVLLVCVGQATRLIEYIMAGSKTYRATIRFGLTTDTYDKDGQVIANADPSALTKETVTQALSKFVGEIDQTPPPFSAIKKEGVPLYKLARKGIMIQARPRRIRIEAINPIQWQLPEVVVDVICQTGTYIRSLAHDAGQMLGVGAYLTGLIRLASGNWSLDNAISLEVLEQAVVENRLQSVLHAQEEAVVDMPGVQLSPAQARAVRFGQSIDAVSTWNTSPVAGFDPSGKLVAILSTEQAGFLKPKKVFSEL
jgi:tRNA pseudouridine55 synthase